MGNVFMSAWVLFPQYIQAFRGRYLTNDIWLTAFLICRMIDEEHKPFITILL